MSPQIPESYPPPDKSKRPDFPLVPSKVQAKRLTGTLPDKFLASLVTRVSQTNLQQLVNNLSAFHTRHTKSTYIAQVATWLSNQFKSFGYTDVIKFPYTRGGFNLENIVCTKEGVGNTGRIIIICGHYDCIMENPLDANARGPGADDNASGIAVLLEVARILADVVLEDTVQFVGFSGEEQGMWGSFAYAQHLQANQISIHRLINLDMVGYSPTGSSIVVERDIGNNTQVNDLPSQEFGNLMAQMAADYTTIPVLLGEIFASDYIPFEARGIAAIGLYEGEGNPNYHHASDTPSTINYSYLADAARITLATVLGEAAAVIDETSSAVDVYIRDNAADTGDQPSASPYWESPDIWVRNNPPPADPADPSDPNFGENPEEGHQPPINNVLNYLYARVHNRGTQVADGLSVKAFRCDPGTGMIWPDHFTLIGEMPVTEPVPPNNSGSARVGPFIWTPQIVDHECLLAIVSGPGDHAIPDIYSGQLEHGLLVRYDNNVGQRNVQPYPSTPGGKTKTAILVRGTTHPSINSLVLDASALPPDTEITMRVRRKWIDKTGSLNGFGFGETNTIWASVYLSGGKVGSILDFPLDSNEVRSALIEIDFSYQAEHLKRYPIMVSQEQDGVAAGRLTIEITAVKESEDYVYGNVRSRELHIWDCSYRRAMKPCNQVPFQTIQEALARGYNGCSFCLPEYNNE